MTGEDSLAGTVEDYTINLLFVDDCSTADVSVELLPFDDDETIAACGARADFSFPQTPVFARHYSLVKPTALERITIALNADLDWDFSVEIFFEGFESGDTSEWDITVP